MIPLSTYMAGRPEWYSAGPTCPTLRAAEDNRCLSPLALHSVLTAANFEVEREGGHGFGHLYFVDTNDIRLH